MRTSGKNCRFPIVYDCIPFDLNSVNSLNSTRINSNIVFFQGNCSMGINKSIKENLALIEKSTKSSADHSEDNLPKCRLIAVSKFIDVSKILEAYQAGQRLFGENRVQEIQTKSSVLPADIEWHMIGHLQTNKVKAVVKVSHLIHSVDSLRLLNKIHTAAKEISKKQDILIQANIMGEESKSGASLKVTELLLADSLKMPWVNCKGFMTIPPLASTEDDIRYVFRRLCLHKTQMEKKLEISLPELSMGMSGDYKIAINEGATLVRIGTAIFGSRKI